MWSWLRSPFPFPGRLSSTAEAGVGSGEDEAGDSKGTGWPTAGDCVESTGGVAGAGAGEAGAGVGETGAGVGETGAGRGEAGPDGGEAGSGVGDAGGGSGAAGVTGGTASGVGSCGREPGRGRLWVGGCFGVDRWLLTVGVERRAGALCLTATATSCGAPADGCRATRLGRFGGCDLRDAGRNADGWARTIWGAGRNSGGGANGVATGACSGASASLQSRPAPSAQAQTNTSGKIREGPTPSLSSPRRTTSTARQPPPDLAAGPGEPASIAGAGGPRENSDA